VEHDRPMPSTIARRVVRLLCAAGVVAGAAVWVGAAYGPGLLAARGSSAGQTASPRPPEATPGRNERRPEVYPPPELVEACSKHAAAVRREQKGKLNVISRPPFVVAGDVALARLDSYARWSVVRPAQSMWKAYFEKKPTDVITIFLFAGKKNYVPYAKRDYPRGNQPYFGYYMPTDRRLVMDINTGTGTLVHELTHALIVYDFPDVPTWFNEGLASLHEQCSVKEDTIVGLTNWRLAGLQAAIVNGALRPLRETVTKRDFYGRLQGANYAQARYFVMYMQTRGLLRKFYKHFRANHAGSGADVKAVEHVFGKKIEQVDKAFVAWVKALRFDRR